MDDASTTDRRLGVADRGITTRTERIWLRDDGVVHVVIHPGAEQDQAAAENGMAMIWEVAGRRVRPLFVDITGMKGVDRSARAYYAGPGPESVICATALLVSSPLTRAIATFVMGLVRAPVVPIRTFTAEADAIAWLRDFRR